MVDERYLINIHGTLWPTTANYIIFSAEHGLFLISDHNISLKEQDLLDTHWLKLYGGVWALTRVELTRTH